MNKLLTLLLYVYITSTVSNAQAPIIDSTVVIQTGQSVQIGQISNGSLIPSGVSGPQQTYDYSVLPSFFANITITGIDNALSPLAANFPQANSTTSWAGAGNPFYHFETTNSSYNYLGGGSGSFYYTYSDIYEQLHFPFTYLDSYTDSFVAVSNFGAIRAGNVVVTGDGYGTLLLPTQTIDDVLRIKRHMTYYDTISGNPRFNDETYYEYYKANHPNYLLLHGFYTITTQGSSPVNGSQLFVNNSIVTSINTKSNTNALNAKLIGNNQIEIQSLSNENIQISIHNLLGQVCQQELLTIQKGTTILPINIDNNQQFFIITVSNGKDKVVLKGIFP